MESADTIAAIATAPGTGGVGVIRVSGPSVPVIMEGLAGRRLVPRTAVFVRFVDEAGAPIDEGLGLFFAAPRSYTGEDVFEIQGHGGPVVLSRLLQRCLDLGARLAGPGEFTQRAFLNGKLDLAQAEAVADLIASRTEQAARSAVRSLTGEFSRLVGGFQEELSELRMLLEASLDFPEEGTDFLARIDVSARFQQLLESVEKTLRAGRAGRLLQDGLAVVLVGAPNVGKSSLINMLCGSDVAIVTPVPGTTRDPIKETIQIDGIPIQIVDTAGVRRATDVVEELGIARTWQAVETNDVVLVVMDESGSSVLDAESLARLPATGRRVWVHNKIDLVGRSPCSESIEGETHVWISATTGAGLEHLKSAIVASEVTAAGAGETPFAARERQLRSLRAVRAAIRSAMLVLGLPELAAEELRLGQIALSEITGEVTADDILGEIFSRFCIGK